MQKSKSETARSLAKVHFKNEPQLRHVHLLEPLNEDDPRDPIKLLEVVEGTLERGIEPVAFPADPTQVSTIRFSSLKYRQGNIRRLETTWPA